MCGIAGFVSPQGLEHARLETMVRTLRHRGPDDEGVRVFDGAAGRVPGTDRGRVGLAQQRLAILDLSPAGRNPFANDDGSIWLTFNGEIFNFREIRSELEKAGFRFHTGTDTEVIVKAYELWGRACLDRFVGMFALAIWDSRSNALFAARDRLGIKPLYYLWSRGELAFGSELKALEPHPAFSGAIDRASLAQFLRFQYIASPRSIYEDVFKLPPGHWLEWKDGRLTIERYWDPVGHALAAPSTLPEPEIEERFDALLSQAVRYRMISDVPLGAFLSGGVDSSAVVALMQENAAGPVSTFSIGFEEAEQDEAPWARAVALHLGTNHHERVCTTKDALELVPLLAQHYDEPFSDSSAIPTMLVSRFARERVTVALSGDGGDELFWGYRRYSAFARMRPLLSAPAAVRRAAALLVSALPDPRAKKAARLLAAAAPPDYYLPFVETIDAARALGLAGREGPVPDLYADARDRLGETRPDAVSVRDLVSYLPEDILTKVDRASMAFSLEARVPLLDHRLVEFALSVPFGLKERDGRGKYLLRRSLLRRVPSSLVDRPKAGFEIPLRRWLTSDLSESVREALSPRAIAADGLVDPDSAAELIGADLSGADREPAAVWSLYMLHLWAEAARSRQSALRAAGREPEPYPAGTAAASAISSRA